MKRWMPFFLILTLCLAMVGCAEKEPQIQVPVTFYYRQNELSFGDASGVVTSEERESVGHDGDVVYLLNQYLQGPVSENLGRTFPSGTKLISFSIEQKKASVLVSRHLSGISGIDLTIACACITMTTMELTGAKTVEIRADSSLLNDMESIIMDENCLLLLDDGAIKPAD